MGMVRQGVNGWRRRRCRREVVVAEDGNEPGRGVHQGDGARAARRGRGGSRRGAKAEAHGDQPAAAGPAARRASCSMAGIPSSRRWPTRARRFRRLLATENSARRLVEALGDPARSRPRSCGPTRSAGWSSPDAVHQGLYLEADPLPSPTLDDPAGRRAAARPRPDHRSAQCRRHHPHVPRPSASPPSSRRPATARPPPACWRSPPRAGSSMCRSSSCAISPRH